MPYFHDNVAFSVGTLIILGIVPVPLQLFSRQSAKFGLMHCIFVGWVGISRYILQLIGSIFQQVMGGVSSQLHSKEESAEDRSRNEGICVPFVKGDGMYCTMGYTYNNHKWNRTCNFVNSNIQCYSGYFKFLTM